MKNLLSVLAMALVPVSLLAQTKPTVTRKSVSSYRPSSARPVARPTTVHATTVFKAPVAAPVAVDTAASSTPTPPATLNAKPETTGTVAHATTAPASAKAPKAAKTTPVVKATPDKRSNANAGFRMGFRTGGSASTITGFNAADLGSDAVVENVTGFHGGLIMSFGGRVISVQPEILYSQFGFKVAGGSDYIQFKYNMVEVPVMLKATFGQSNARFFINAGPTATYWLGGTVSFHQDGETGSQAITIGANDGRLNYGGAAGLGLALKAGPGSLQVEIRGTYLISSDTDVKMQNGKLSLAYLIPL